MGASCAAAAQALPQPPAGESGEARPVLRAARVESAPEIDGGVLDDPAWASVVYDEIGEIGDDPLFARPDRSLIVKYSYLIDIFH